MHRLSHLFLAFSAVLGLTTFFLSTTAAEKPARIQKKLVFPFPGVSRTQPNQTRFSCATIVGSYMESNPNDYIVEAMRGVQTKIFKGTDKLYFEIENDKLYFLTRASVELGIIRDTSPLSILSNVSGRIIAVELFQGGIGESVNLLVLDTATGIGTWIKTLTKDLLTQYPITQSHYFKCQ